MSSPQQGIILDLHKVENGWEQIRMGLISVLFRPEKVVLITNLLNTSLLALKYVKVIEIYRLKTLSHYFYMKKHIFDIDLTKSSLLGGHYLQVFNLKITGDRALYARLIHDNGQIFCSKNNFWQCLVFETTAK